MNDLLPRAAFRARLLAGMMAMLDRFQRIDGEQAEQPMGDGYSPKAHVALLIAHQECTCDVLAAVAHGAAMAPPWPTREYEAGAVAACRPMRYVDVVQAWSGSVFSVIAALDALPDTVHAIDPAFAAHTVERWIAVRAALEAAGL